MDGISHLASSLLSLSLGKTEAITDTDLCSFTRLTQLSISFNKKITNDGISTLTSLRSLSCNESITADGISMFSNLKNLQALGDEWLLPSSSLHQNISSLQWLKIGNISSFGSLCLFTCLTTLHLVYARNFSKEDNSHPFLSLTNLTSLTLENDPVVPIAAICSLPLEYLSIIRSKFPNEVYGDIPTLQTLSIEKSICFDHLSSFRSVRELKLSFATGISSSAFSSMTSLDTLILWGMIPFQNDAFCSLVKLRRLELMYCGELNDALFSCLTHLTTLFNLPTELLMNFFHELELIYPLIFHDSISKPFFSMSTSKTQSSFSSSATSEPNLNQMSKQTTPSSTSTQQYQIGESRGDWSKVILITGPPRVGKTETVNRVMGALKSEVDELKEEGAIRGFLTTARVEGNTRTGFDIGNQNSWTVFLINF